jgi:hypothetical protein
MATCLMMMPDLLTGIIRESDRGCRDHVAWYIPGDTVTKKSVNRGVTNFRGLPIGQQPIRNKNNIIKIIKD